MVSRTVKEETKSDNKKKNSEATTKILSRILSPEYRGPRASFGSAQALKAILITGSSSSSPSPNKKRASGAPSAAGGIGRGRLGAELGLGQGEIRTLIRRMKDNGIVTVESSGCRLTELGRRLCSQFQKQIPWSGPVECGALGLAETCWALIIRATEAKKSLLLKRGIEQRDAALLGGASSTLTLIFRNGRFLVPGEDTDAEAHGAGGEPWQTLRQRANLRQGDVVIICGGIDLLSAEYGALSAALTLI